MAIHTVTHKAHKEREKRTLTSSIVILSILRFINNPHSAAQTLAGPYGEKSCFRVYETLWIKVY